MNFDLDVLEKLGRWKQLADKEANECKRYIAALVPDVQFDAVAPLRPSVNCLLIVFALDAQVNNDQFLAVDRRTNKCALMQGSYKRFLGPNGSWLARID